MCLNSGVNDNSQIFNRKKIILLGRMTEGIAVIILDSSFFSQKYYKYFYLYL